MLHCGVTAWGDGTLSTGVPLLHRAIGQDRFVSLVLLGCEVGGTGVTYVKSGAGLHRQWNYHHR